MGSGEVAIVALSTMISLKVTFSDGLGGEGRMGSVDCSLCGSFQTQAVHTLRQTPYPSYAQDMH